MPVRVAFIVGQLGLGGAEQQLYYLLSNIDRSRFRPTVITLGRDSEEYWVQPIKMLGTTVYHVGHSAGRLGRIAQIWSLILSENVKIIHSWDLHTNPYVAAAGRLARVPLRLGSMRLNYYGIPNERLLRWIAFRGLDVLVTNSATAADQVRQFGLTKADIRFVANGVPIPDARNQVDRYRLKVELCFSERDLLIGSIGRLDVNKNHAMLLRVFAKLSERWNTLRLVIIGDGPLRVQLLAMANDLGLGSKICLPGAVPLAARYLSAMEVCCLTSHTEGMPNLIMEAAAAGIPVVSTYSGGSTDLIEDEVSGYLVAPNDDADMRAKIHLLLEDPKRRYLMGQAGLEKMRRDFSIERMVTRMTEIYEQGLVKKGIVSAKSPVEPRVA